jgi:exoribonuclease R
MDNNIHPFTNKLFHGDMILFSEQNLKIQYSPVRTARYIAGVLNLDKNLTYGRTPNKKKLYYSCTPFQKELPIFLIPYEIILSFQKTPRNKYVIFRFDHWNPDEKHPYGLLLETIGDVDHLPFYYEYQLYAKYLHPNLSSLKKRKYTIDIETEINSILLNPLKYGDFQDRRNSNMSIFSIDPKGCMDRDDALSISKTDNPSIFHVSVYIANVWVWIAFFDLWDLLSETNVSTIYLPDRNRHMLPTGLTETICSLDEKKSCLAFVMDFEVNIVTKDIQVVNIYQTCIRVSNYDYECPKLLKNRNYILLLNISQILDSTICDSHQLVEFWMMKMNIHMAKDLYQKKMGIFRTASSLFTSESTNFIDSTIPFLRIWEQRISGEYVLYDENRELSKYHHSILDTPIYTHFTSPIRRMVDLINQILWIGKYILDPNRFMERINRDSTCIRKIQNECELLYSLQFIPISERVEGIVLQVNSDSKPGIWKYTIYLPKYKGILSLKESREIKKGEKIICSLFLFQREDETKKKIKVNIVS